MITENKKYFVAQVNSSKANQFTKYYHYSHVGFKKAKLNLGVFNRDTKKLVGVMQWGCSAQENIRLDRYVKEPITTDEYYELNRFCMADSELENSESQALSLGIKWIKKYQPHIRLLVSYAGRKEGNVGYIYQATNWEYLGYFISSGFWNIDGQEVHQLTLWYRYNKSEYKDKTFLDALRAMYHYVEQTWTKQFIYIQRLDSQLTTADNILPYPKVDDGPILIRSKIYKNEPLIENNKNDIGNAPDFYYDDKELLFTRRKLIRDGVIKPKQDIIASYNDYGQLIETKQTASAYGPTYTIEGIHRSCISNKFYKDRVFKKFSQDDEIPEEIDVPICCIIDEIPFRNLTEAAKYLNVSRQAVSASKQRKAKMINGIDVLWVKD